MDRTLDLKKTAFHIPEMYLSGRSMVLDVIQCNRLDLHVKDSMPQGLTFEFVIKENPNLVGGMSELTDLREGIDRFSRLVINDDYIIKRLENFVTSNPGWSKYPLAVKISFHLAGIKAEFPIELKPSRWDLTFSRQQENSDE